MGWGVGGGAGRGGRLNTIWLAGVCSGLIRVVPVICVGPERSGVLPGSVLSWEGWSWGDWESWMRALPIWIGVLGSTHVGVGFWRAAVLGFWRAAWIGSMQSAGWWLGCTASCRCAC